MGITVWSWVSNRQPENRRFERLKNSYWFCHQHFKSSAKAYYRDIHNLLASLGPFDVVMIGMCLPHIRDPLGALQSVTAKSRETVIITQQTFAEDRPFMQMIPYPDLPDIAHIRYAWWTLSDGCITNFMRIMGFRLENKYRASYRCCAYIPERSEDCTTFIFRRL
jgi:hypothetical protein